MEVRNVSYSPCLIFWGPKETQPNFPEVAILWGPKETQSNFPKVAQSILHSH